MDARRGFIEHRPAPGWSVAEGLLLVPMLALAYLAGRALTGSWLAGHGPSDAFVWGLLPLAFIALSLRLAARTHGGRRVFAIVCASACVIAFGLASSAPSSPYPFG